MKHRLSRWPSSSSGRLRGGPIYLRFLLSSSGRPLSVQLNISEGYTFGDSPTFTRHLSVAYGSAVETGELLQLLGQSGIIDAASLAEVRKRNAQCQRLILGLLKRRRAFR